MKSITLLILLSLSLGSFAQDSIFGKWKTIDDKTGKPRALVEIYERDGLAYGKIVKTFPALGGDPDPICDKCIGPDKDQKVIGMEIIRAMKKEGEEWKGGTILDAEEGKTYSCKIWLEEGVLKVRGYIAFFFRTQEWMPFSGG